MRILKCYDIEYDGTSFWYESINFTYLPTLTSSFYQHDMLLREITTELQPGRVTHTAD